MNRLGAMDKYFWLLILLFFLFSLSGCGSQPINCSDGGRAHYSGGLADYSLKYNFYFDPEPIDDPIVVFDYLDPHGMFNIWLDNVSEISLDSTKAKQAIKYIHADGYQMLSDDNSVGTYKIGVVEKVGNSYLVEFHIDGSDPNFYRGVTAYIVSSFEDCVDVSAIRGGNSLSEMFTVNLASGINSLLERDAYIFW